MFAQNKYLAYNTEKTEVYYVQAEVLHISRYSRTKDNTKKPCSNEKQADPTWTV